MSTGRKIALMGDHDAVNFFTTNATAPAIIPCAGTVPQDEKVKLLKTARQNRVQ